MVRSSLGSELARVGQLQAHLPGPVVVLIGVAALGAAVLPDVWLVTRNVNIIAHEGAHATMGSALGARVLGVRMSRGGVGATAVQGGDRASSVLSLAIGYLGPSAFGLGAAKLIQVGHAIAVLWITLAALLLLAVAVRRSGFGLAVVIVTGTAIFAVARYAPVGAEVAVAYGIAWFLLLSGVQVVLSHGRDASDAITLRQLTRLPRGLWAALWLAGSALALVAGARMLV
jgi:Peptidase M50B-like